MAGGCPLELQEACALRRPCNWDNISCVAELLPTRVCPTRAPPSLRSSAVGRLLTDRFAAFLLASAAACLLLSPLIVMAWRRATRHWDAARPPRKRPPLPPLCAPLAVACAASLAAFSSLAPHDVWGGCEERGVCVYHSMFCEYTRHAAAVRHPANFWSNLVYLGHALFLCLQAAADLRARTARSFALLDGIFGAVSLSHSLASFAWHGSNCTEVHFVDVALMDCVICFFPLRFGAMALASLLRRADRDVSAAAAAAYCAVCAALVRKALRLAPLYHFAFPTGRARSDLTIEEVAAIVALPALYPLPSWFAVGARRRWGSVGAMYLATFALPLGFAAQLSERWAVDLFCEPGSLWLQPTAALHVATGVTIAAAYVHVRSIQDD
ncbi:hypothetical protein AB1Y20_016376 [Prymnesium parvum]|uniref:Post-GPI attachment to proteins factor 3 n=1 Tax=Prymnesium parvum TaxID=97485 RepID=A0AB34ICN2_PRYPA